MNKKIYKSFIIGCGRVAGYSEDSFVNDFTHGYAYQNNPNIKLVGCMDIHLKKGKLFSNKFNCTFFDDFKSGVASTKSEIVSVCTPDDTHFKIVKTLIKMDSNIKIIFLEKPACSTMNELEELIYISKEQNIDVVVNHTRRFDIRYQHLKNNIANGSYGSLVDGFITYYSGWRHNGVHIIDTLSFLFDDEIKIKSLKNGAYSPYRDDPTLNGKLFFSTLPGSLNLFSFDERYYQLFDFDLRFEKTRLRIEDFGSRIFLEKKDVNNIGENILIPTENKLPINKRMPIQVAIDLFVHCLNNNNVDYLYGYRLEDVTGTMKTIWEGIELYDD